MNKTGLKVSPLLTQGRPAEKSVQWKRIQVGTNVQTSVEVPEFWSETAAIISSKYFRKKGHHKSAPMESSLKHLLSRVFLAIEKSAKNQKYFATPKDLSVFINELKYLIIHQMAAFNSPVWFNVGLFEAYGLKSEGEHWAYDFKAKKVKPVRNAFARPQCSACFIQSVDDSLEGIFNLVRNEAKLFKYGSGTGTNFSSLRSKYENINVGGTSSGLISFLEVLDKGAGAIKSGGTTRRAAKMVLLDDDHPELLDFIQWKSEEEKKAQALIKAGYSSAFEGAAYKTVSGQNSNNSVRFSDAFMKSLLKNEKWKLKSSRTQETIQELPSGEIWSRLAQAAWSCADPGVQFSDTINEWHTCSNTAPIRASNPCSEYLFLDNSACNLASLNLVHFFKDGKFESEKFLHAVRILFIAQEILVDYSSYPTEEIAQNSHDYRPLGLGYANLGSAMMRLGLGYDSDSARQWTSVISSLMTAKAYLTSTEMAKHKGSFGGYKKNKNVMLKVIKKHLQASLKMTVADDLEGLHALSNQLWKSCLSEGTQHGYRNAQATVVAPTGTIGLMMDCDTFGIEPDFSLFKFKTLVGGGSLEMINQSVGPALKAKGLTDAEIQIILDKMVLTKSLKGLISKELEPIFETANGEFPLKPMAHLKIMAAAQPFISGAISKTVNLPQSATPRDISELLIQAWQLKLKAVAIYRDHSKGSQPLETIECLDC
jgi:ribonucleoside-diphosphate reductase alpha chain